MDTSLTLAVLDPAAPPARVHVVSGSFGAGHDAAAREIAARLTEAGHLVTTWDVVDLLSARIGPLVRATYLRQLAISPRSWGVLLQHLRPGRPAHRLVSRVLGLAGPRLLDIDVRGADLFVSTHPFASQALGRLRRRGRLTTPVVTYLTDMSVHPLWVHPDVDLHLALHEVAAKQARAWGGRTTVVAPLTPRAVDPGLAIDRDSVRREIGLTRGERVVLVMGGSLGIGELEQSALDVLGTGLATPVVLCGSNTALRERLSRRTGVVALGWRDDLPVLLDLADCALQNAGGFMSLEALAVGVPVVSHRVLPGHGTTNAAALEEAGLAAWAHSDTELRTEIETAFSTRGALPRHAPELLDVLSVRAVAVAA